MNCIRCGVEMKSTTGDNYTCPKCDMEVNDLVYRPQNCDMPLPQDFDKQRERSRCRKSRLEQIGQLK